jgi:nitrogen fixation/metabolism regulation signal transduction histidine kinase
MSHPSRKKTFVDPMVQGALVRRLVLHWVAFIAVASVVAFALQVLTNPFQPIERHLQEMWWTHGPFLLVMFFMLPVFIVDTIKLSHRFAGPIYRLRNVIKGMAEGEPFKPVKFREMDFWQDLADDFNTMIERVGKANEARSSEPIETEAGALVGK